MDDFPCTKCGECCRQASKVLDKSSDFYKTAPTVIKDLIDRFPYEVNIGPEAFDSINVAIKLKNRIFENILINN